MSTYILEKISGGISESSITGLGNDNYTSVQDAVGIDYRTDPDKITALKKLSKDSGSNVTDLVNFMVENTNNDTWMYGDSGKIYKRTSVGTYSNPKTVSDSHGNGIEIFNNALWYASDSKLGKATDLTGSTVFTDDYFTDPTYEAPDLAQILTGNTYTVPTSVSETSANKISFTTTVTTFAGISLAIAAKGTGNWTFILHNASDTVLAQQTVANATLANASVRVLFGGVTLTAGQTYHIHITSTVADGTVTTGTASNLSTALFSVLQTLPGLDIDQQSAIGTGVFTSFSTTYLLLTTISENSIDRREFTPSVSNLAAISVMFISKSSADVTLTVHDSNNTVIGSATLLNANIKGRLAWNKFVFSSPLTVTPGGSYHYHLTATAATAVDVISSVSNSLAGGYYKTHFSMLDSDTSYHTMKVYQNLLCIGNGQFLSTIDDSEVVTREALTFPKGERVRCIETIGDYLAVSTWKGTLTDGKSRIYFWDGTAPTFNAFVDIDGVVNSMKNNGENMLFIIHGTQGHISIYTGGITKVRKIKNAEGAIQTFVNPAATEIWESLLYFGNYGSTSNNIDTLVYSYGRKSNNYPYSLNKDYPISTGVKTTAVTIGSILGISASKFLVSWKDTSSGTVYGVDIIDNSNAQSSVNFTTLRFRGGKNADPNREKSPKAVSLRFDPLTANHKITLAYRINGGTNFTTIGTIDATTDSSLVGAVYKSFDFTNPYFLDIEFKVTMETTGASALTLLTLEMEFEGKDRFQLDQV